MAHGKTATWAVGIVASALATWQGAAASVLWSGSGGTRAASARFQTAGNNLEVTLTNTASSDALQPTDILTSVFFNIGGASVSLTPVSAVLASGSVVYFGSTDAGGAVGGEWAYKGGPMSGFSAGISASGLGIFGPPDLFGGTNLQGPASPDGINYGITSAGDNPGTGNTPVTGTNALIKNSVVFRLGGIPAGFDVGRIDAVRFQYGTDLSEPHLDGSVPAPGAMALGALGGLLVVRRRRHSCR